MNKPLLAIVFGIGSVVAGAWYLLQPPNEKAVLADAAAEAAKSAKAGGRGSGSVAVLPTDNPQRASSVKLAPARTVVPLKSALAQEFEKARQMKPFYDRYMANPESADAETKFFAAIAMSRCIGRGKGVPAQSQADLATKFQSRLKENDPANAQRIEAFNRIGELCEGFGNVPINPAEISRLVREAAMAGNPGAKVEMLAEVQRDQTRGARGIEERRLSEESLATLRESLASGDPFAMERAGQLLSYQSSQLAERKVGPNGDFYNPRDWLPAWQLVACDRGANCGADAFRVLNGCANQGACGYDSLETYMQFNELPPNVYAAALQNRALIADAIAQGRWDWLGIAPGMGRTVNPTPVATGNSGNTGKTTVVTVPGKKGG
jgi:hypothetical protein